MMSTLRKEVGEYECSTRKAPPTCVVDHIYIACIPLLISRHALPTSLGLPASLVYF